VGKKIDFVSLKKSRIKSLYKYSRFDPNEHYKDLLNNILYFPNITQLNDPFDSQIPIQYNRCSDQELDELIIRTISGYDPRYAHYHLMRIDAKIEFRKNPQDLEGRLFHFIKGRVGVFALTEKIDNLLLWTHYTNNHSGFCLEYDAQKLYNLLVEVFVTQNVKAFIFKVKYQNEYPIIIPRINNAEERLQKQFLIKSKDWEYEQEWRILVLDGIRKNEIESGYLKNIYFGLNASQKKIETSIDILKTSNPDIGLFKAVKKKDEFGLEFEKI